MPTQAPDRTDRHRAQCGAITIMVALMMLVLLTIAAVSMSRNAFREVVNTGFNRQSALADNTADAGLEWAIYWLDMRNSPSAGQTAAKMVALQATLIQNPLLLGVAKAITDTSGGTAYSPGGGVLGDMTLPVPTGAAAESQGAYTLGLTYMGKLSVQNMSQGAGTGAYTPAISGLNTQAPDLWVIRSDAQVPQGNVTFTHGKEAWVTTPVQ